MCALFGKPLLLPHGDPFFFDAETLKRPYLAAVQRLVTEFRQQFEETV
jgi:hypothetical protein